MGFASVDSESGDGPFAIDLAYSEAYRKHNYMNPKGAKLQILPL